MSSNRSTNASSVFSSFLNSKNLGFSREKDLANQRNLLERMVQERDEQISALQKSMDVQNGHILKLHSQIELSDRREKQHETRHKVQLESMVNDQNMLKSQLQLMQDEVKRIKNDPIHLALTAIQEDDPIESVERSRLWKEKIQVPEEEKEKIKLANDAQGILLQGQLYQAMTSLSQLRGQTVMMKESYEAIVKSLQTELTSASDRKAQEEAKLLNQIYTLEQETKVSVQALQDKLRIKDDRIKALEEKMNMLEKDVNESHNDATVDVDGNEGEGGNVIPGNNKSKVPKESDGRKLEPDSSLKGKSYSSSVPSHSDFPFVGKSVGVRTGASASVVSDMGSKRVPTALKELKDKTEEGNNKTEGDGSPNDVSDAAFILEMEEESQCTEEEDDDCHSNGNDTEIALTSIM